MKILGLPGVNPATKNWLQALLTALGEDGPDATILEYRHWSEDSDADIGHETSRLENLTVDLVIAKSFGTAVATQAFDTSGFRPGQAVFIGCPLKRHGADDYALLRRFVESVPTLFIQQSADFAGSYRELHDIVGGLGNATTREVPGDDHVYGDIEELRGLIRSAL
jgi:hypothetical protein